MFHSLLKHMQVHHLSAGLLLTGLLLTSAVSAQSKGEDPSKGQVQLVSVEPDVKLEVKDWGGTGRPVVLLAGLGGTLHGFDHFAPMLTDTYHVYGVTRRGYGASSAPDPIGDNYAADRLGDDVLSVLDQLNIQHPVLIGHSFAGEELSSICSRFPARAAGYVYLDASFRYAFSPISGGDFRIDALELRHQLTSALDAISPAEETKAIARLQELLPQFQTDLTQEKQLSGSAPAMSAKTIANRCRNAPPAQDR